MKAIVYLYGGLGNQLFQIQHAFRISRQLPDRTVILDYGLIKNSISDAIDITFLEDNFVIEKNFWTSRIIWLLSKVRILTSTFISVESSRILKYNIGYWQVYSESLLHSFNLGVLRISNVEKEECIGMHFRFGDYLSRRNLSLYAELSVIYYVKAYKFLVGENVMPLLIFTNDVDYFNFKVRPSLIEELGPVSITYDRSNTDRDLVANMLKCRKLVSANSTLSLLLGSSSYFEKENVVFPDVWFKNVVSYLID